MDILTHLAGISVLILASFGSCAVILMICHYFDMKKHKKYLQEFYKNHDIPFERIAVVKEIMKRLNLNIVNKL